MQEGKNLSKQRTDEGSRIYRSEAIWFELSTGTVINVGAIIVGGISGLIFGRFIGERHKDSLCKSCGLAVIFIGCAGAIKGMFSVTDGKLTYGGDFLIIICLALGALVGEIINVCADESILGSDGKVDVAKLQPITYDSMHHQYLVLGEKVGHAFHDGLILK